MPLYRNPYLVASMSSLNLSSFLLYLSVLGFSASVAAEDSTGKIPYQHAIQATQTCNSCHEQSRVNVFNSTMANDCEECHSSGESSPIVRVEDRHFADPYALNHIDPP